MNIKLLAPSKNLLTSKLLTQIGQNRKKKETQRKLAIAIGLFCLTANIVGPIGFGIELPILTESNYLTSIASNETKWLLAVLLEHGMALTVVGLAIAIYPILKKIHTTPGKLVLGAKIFGPARSDYPFLSPLLRYKRPSVCRNWPLPFGNL